MLYLNLNLKVSSETYCFKANIGSLKFNIFRLIKLYSYRNIYFKHQKIYKRNFYLTLLSFIL